MKAATYKALAGELHPKSSSGPSCVVPGRVTVHVDDLLVQIAHGSRSALAELYDLLAPLLLALLRTREGSAERAHSALVDAFARIWRKAPSYEPGHGGLDWILDQTAAGDSRKRGMTA